MTALESSTIDPINAEPLRYWRERKYTEQDTRSLISNRDSTLLMCVTVRPGKNLELLLSRKVAETKQGHAPAVMQMMRWVLTTWGDDHPTGSIVFWLEDGNWNPGFGKIAPLFAFAKSKDDQNSFLMPDAAFLTTSGYERERCAIADIEAQKRWHDKQPTMFWRGSSSGLGADGDQWREAPRARLTYAAKVLNDSATLDAKFSAAVSYGNNSSSAVIVKDGLVAEPIPFEQFLNYRYLIDVDGESCAWRSLFLKLSSKSLVLKVESPYVQWYYPELIPMQHFVPLRADLSDLKERMQWLRENDAAAQAIAERASTMMRQFTFELACARFATSVTEILRCQKAVI